MPRIAVVGATTGLGRRICRKALQKGFTVIAVVEDEKQGKKVFDKELKSQPKTTEKKEAEIPHLQVRMAVMCHVGTGLKEAFAGCDVVVEVLLRRQMPSEEQQEMELTQDIKDKKDNKKDKTGEDTEVNNKDEAGDDGTSDIGDIKYLRKVDEVVHLEAVKAVMDAVEETKVPTFIVCGVSGCLFPSGEKDSPRAYQMLTSTITWEGVAKVSSLCVRVQDMVFSSHIPQVYAMCPPDMKPGVVTSMRPSINLTVGAASGHDVSYEDVADVLMQTLDHASAYNRHMIGVKYLTDYPTRLEDVPSHVLAKKVKAIDELVLVATPGPAAALTVPGSPRLQGGGQSGTNNAVAAAPTQSVQKAPVTTSNEGLEQDDQINYDSDEYTGGGGLVGTGLWDIERDFGANGTLDAKRLLFYLG